MQPMVTTKAIAKVAAVATGLAIGVSMLAFASSAYAATSCSFTRSLTIGSRGTDVTCLQNWLIGQGYSIPAGATGYFGNQTKGAVAKWQAAAGVSPAAGYFGPKSRAAAAGAATTGGGSTGGTVTVGSGNGLEVMLSPTSPNGSVLVQGQGIGDLADFTFANPTALPITVTSIVFHRIGVSNDQTINNVYLYNGVNRITDSAGVSNSQFAFQNAGGLFTVLPGATYTVSVRADIVINTSGQQIGASIVAVSASSALDSSVTFPILSGYQTISAANLATVQFSSSANTLPQGSPTISPQSDYTVWQNSVSVSTNAVWLRSMKFTNLGSIDNTNLQNVRLYVDGVQVGGAVAQVGSDRTVTFDFSAAPVLLSTQTHIIKALANVVGGASLTFQFSLQRSSDGMFIDSQLGQPVTPTVSGSTNFTPVNASQVTIQSVSGGSGVSVSKDPTSASNSVSVGASNVNWATFDLLASGENTKVMDLFVCAIDSVSGSTSVNAGLKNGKVYFNGVQVGSTKDIAECSSTSNSTGQNTDYGLGSSLILPAGQQAKVDIYADAKTSTSTNLVNNETVTVKLVAQGSLGNANAQGQSSYNSVGVPSGTTDIAGNSVPVNNSSLAVTKFSGYANQTIQPGTSNAIVGEFTFAAGSTEGVNVNTVVVNLATGGGTILQNLMLKDMSTGAQYGTTLSTPSNGDNSVSVNVPIPTSGTKTVGVYANVLSSATSTTVYAPLTTIKATTSGTGAVTGITANPGGDVALQQITIGAGTFSLALGASNPVSKLVVAGASSLQAGAFTFSANNSALTVQKLEVDASTTAAAAITSVSLQYKDQNGVTQTATLGGPSGTSGSNTVYQFTGLSAYVPMNDSRDVTVWVGTPTISSGGAGISGLPIVVALNHNTNFQAQDSSGTLNTSIGSADVLSNANAGYGKLVVRKSVPTFAGQSLSSSASPNSSSALYQFTIAADAAGAVDFYQLTFNVATTIMSASALKLYDAANPSQPLNATGVNADGSGNVSIIPDQIIQIPSGSSKTFILRATTISGWASGAGISTHFATADAAAVANAAAGSVSGTPLYVWTDRSLNTDLTSDAQWTNGYLLKDLVSGTYSYTANF